MAAPWRSAISSRLPCAGSSRQPSAPPLRAGAVPSTLLAAVPGQRNAYPAIRRCRIGVATITVSDVERSEWRVRKDATLGDAVSDLVAFRSGKIVPSVPRGLFVCLPVLRSAAGEVDRAVVTSGLLEERERVGHRRCSHGRGRPGHTGVAEDRQAAAAAGEDAHE